MCSAGPLPVSTVSFPDSLQFRSAVAVTASATHPAAMVTPPCAGTKVHPCAAPTHSTQHPVLGLGNITTSNLHSPNTHLRCSKPSQKQP